MRKKFLYKNGTKLLAGLLAVSAFFCSAGTAKYVSADEVAESTAESAAEGSAESEGTEKNAAKSSAESNAAAKDDSESSAENSAEEADASKEASAEETKTGKKLQDVTYVLVYNPEVTEENLDSKSEDAKKESSQAAASGGKESSKAESNASDKDAAEAVSSSDEESDASNQESSDNTVSEAAESSDEESDVDNQESGEKSAAEKSAAEKSNDAESTSNKVTLEADTSETSALTGNSERLPAWISAAMAAYAEELMYPDFQTEVGDQYAFYVSEGYRNGQSLYNYTAETEEDAGSAGAAYLFERYLRGVAGDDIFSNICCCWVDDEEENIAETIAEAVPAKINSDIDTAYAYSDRISKLFDSDEEAWLSKLTLDFYVELMQADIGNLGDEAETAFNEMLYEGDLTDGLPEIEAGGRVILKVSGSYTVSEDDNLVYIGFDKDMKITDTCNVNE